MTVFSKIEIYLLSAAGEEKVDQRSVVGMSQYANALTLMPLAELTHPIYAMLDHPLFCKQKRGLRKFSSLT